MTRGGVRMLAIVVLLSLRCAPGLAASQRPSHAKTQ